MNDQENILESPEEDFDDVTTIEFVLDEELRSSSVTSSVAAPAQSSQPSEMVPDVNGEDSEGSELSSVFAELSEPKLPQLGEENRARLLLQSPNRIYFYWMLSGNPYQNLEKAVPGSLNNYLLVVKLIDLVRNTEEIRPVEPEGSAWFEVEPNTSYEAEIGFYAPNRPFVRILYSNRVETPRKNPSPRADSEADWTVSATKFAEVLDVAGFSSDAFDIAIAGDDWDGSGDVAHHAFEELVDSRPGVSAGIEPDEIRSAMLALAMGLSLAEIRQRVGPMLWALLHAHAENITRAKAVKLVSEKFGVKADELEFEEFGSTVFGLSLVSAPSRLRRQVRYPKLSVTSSPVGQL